jgi:DNA-binding GntR family transcriptional regulator
LAVLRQRPIAEQVTQELHKRILEGVYSPGERLPSESELADEMSVSRGSVRSAMASLAAAGLIDRRQGDGTYVRDVKLANNSLVYAIWEFSQLIKARGGNPSIQAGAIVGRAASKEEASQLGIDPEEKVISVNRLFFADDQPLIFSINVSPASIFSVAQDRLDATLGVHHFIRRFCRREVARVDMDISATLAVGPVQEALALPANTPILCLEQLFHDINRRPLVLATNYLCGSKLSLHDIRPWHSWNRA